MVSRPAPGGRCRMSNAPVAADTMAPGIAPEKHDRNRLRHCGIPTGTLTPPRLFLGPLWDHTLCALLNDLRVCERLAAPKTGAWNGRPARMHYRNFLGVKWVAGSNRVTSRSVRSLPRRPSLTIADPCSRNVDPGLNADRVAGGQLGFANHPLALVAGRANRGH